MGYFNHIHGNCPCQKCSCGACKCPNQKIHWNYLNNQKSTYKQEYKQCPNHIDSRLPIVKQEFYDTLRARETMDLQSTSKLFYKAPQKTGVDRVQNY